MEDDYLSAVCVILLGQVPFMHMTLSKLFNFDKVKAEFYKFK